MITKYAVDSCRDDPVALRDVLDHISEEGGTVFSIMWQPEREMRSDGVTIKLGSGYTIVSEHEFADA